MSVLEFSQTLGVATFSWAQQRRDISMSSPFGSQAVEVAPPAWLVTLASNAMLETSAGEWQSFMLRLRGQTNQISLWNLKRPQPRGTMRGTMTLNIAAAQGDVSLSIIASSEAAKTLVSGDLLGIGTGVSQQVVMVTADATANGSGVIAVNIEPPLRNAHLIAAAVTWDKPKALFRRAQSQTRWEYLNSAVSGFALDLIEDTRT